MPPDPSVPAHSLQDTLDHQHHIRRQMRKKRGQLSPLEQKICSQQATQRLKRHPWYLAAKHIGLYYPYKGELNPLPIEQHTHKTKKKLYLPRLHPLAKRTLTFHTYSAGSRLIENTFGIPEPKHSQHISLWALDLVICPLVAFTDTGQRIGMGGGYYDTTFQKLPGRHLPRLIGYAYSWQQINAYEPNPWDVALDSIVTEHSVFTCV